MFDSKESADDIDEVVVDEADYDLTDVEIVEETEGVGDDNG